MKHLKCLILILVCVTALVLLPYILKFAHVYGSASTEDFANFGGYVSGVLTPIYTLVSVLFIGYQVIEASNSNKLERVITENKTHLKTLVAQVAEVKDLKYIEENAYRCFLNNDDVLLSALEFYQINSNLLHTFSIVSKTLFQIKLLDKRQFEVLRSSIFSAVHREDVARLERLTFYLDNYRYDTCSSTFEWICEESQSMMINDV